MQNLLSKTRRCIDDYKMIKAGDRIAVGLSGGKDSLALLIALNGLRRFYPEAFELEAVTVDLGLGMDFSPLGDLCASLGVNYTIEKTQISEVVFSVRQEENPCSLCARMRKGALFDAAKALGCNKVALGHHFDDAVETMMMNLLFEGRLGCFDPVTYMSRSGLTQIRPLLYSGELALRNFAEREGLPVVKNTCPADGVTSREDVKKLLSELQKSYPDIKSKIFTAMSRLPLGGWGIEK